jgi:voltage-gated potassium channel
MAFMRGMGILWITLTIFLLTLIELSVDEIGGYFFVLMFSVVVALVVAIHVLFDSSVFFSLSLANFISVYTCVFIFFTLTNFQNVPDWAAHVAYTFPLAAFVAKAALRRSDIQSIVTAHRVREERHFGRVLRWLVPVFVFAILTFVARKWFEGSEAETVLLLAYMGAIGATLFFASHDVATFMLDTGTLFEELFQRVPKLLVPAFAFLTFYSMLVIVFACFYRIAGRFSSEPQFLILGRTTELSSLDALYLSLITVSTVGYGEIVPTSNGITTLVSVQIVDGDLLLLFGFYELIHYTRGRTPRIDDE